MNGNDVRAIQKKLGLGSNQDMANRLGVSLRTIGNIRKPDDEVAEIVRLAINAVWFGVADKEIDAGGEVGAELEQGLPAQFVSDAKQATKEAESGELTPH